MDVASKNGHECNSSIWSGAKLIAALLCSACGSPQSPPPTVLSPSAAQGEESTPACSDLENESIEQLDPVEQFNLATCFEKSQRLYDASLIYVRLDDLLRDPIQGKGRLNSFVRRRVRATGFPARLPLVDSAVGIAVEAQLGEHRGLMLWDSAAEGSVLDQRMCVILGLDQFGDMSVSDSATSTQLGVAVGLLRRMTLGPIEISDVPVLCLDLSHVVADEPNFIGVLGGNVLGSSSYQLDLDTKTLTLGGAIPPGVVYFQGGFFEGMPYIEADLDGQSTDFIIDTGLDRSSISQESLDALGATAVLSGKKSGFLRANGYTESEDAFVSFNRFRSGQEQRSDLRMLVGARNLLGLDFFEQQTLVVDRSTSTIGLIRSR